MEALTKTTGRQKVLLIVEDDQALLGILRDEFFKAGFEVLTAHDGEEGLKITLEKHPDLIMVDILMPKMDGLTMLSKIREKEQGKTTPAIILTNLNDNKTINKALETQVYDFLVKSDWDPKSLVKMVKEKLGMAA